MNERTRNEIAIWLLDRVCQGEYEECGSMDWSIFGDGQREITVQIMKYGPDEYLVWMEDYPEPDFTICQNTTKQLILAAIDIWYDALNS